MMLVLGTEKIKWEIRTTITETMIRSHRQIRVEFSQVATLPGCFFFSFCTSIPNISLKIYNTKQLDFCIRLQNNAKTDTNVNSMALSLYKTTCNYQGRDFQAVSKDCKLPTKMPLLIMHIFENMIPRCLKSDLLLQMFMYI